MDYSHQLILYLRFASVFLYSDRFVEADFSGVLFVVVVALDESGQMQDEILGTCIKASSFPKSHLVFAFLAVQIIYYLLSEILFNHIVQFQRAL